MSIVSLLAETAENTPFDYRLIIEYAIYAAIIVVGIFILALLKRADRLPKHTELKKLLLTFSDDLKTFSKTAPSLTRYQFFRRVSKLLYRADKLEFITAQMADKERDGDIETASLRIQDRKSVV